MRMRKETEDDNVAPRRLSFAMRSQIASRLFFSLPPLSCITFTRRLIFTVTLSALTLLATYRFARGELLPLAFLSFFSSSVQLIEKSFSTNRIEIIPLFRLLHTIFIGFFLFITLSYMSLISNFDYL